MLNSLMKKYWWILLLLLYLGIFIFRVIQYVPTNGLDLATVTVFLAIIQTLIQNYEPLKRIILKIYFWLTNIQFRWKYTAEFRMSDKNINQVDERFIRTLIHKIINENKQLQGTKENLECFSRKKGMEFIITFMPLGVNLLISKEYGDSSDEMGEEDSVDYLKVVGDTHIKYRKTKNVLDNFITSLYSELEANLKGITDKKFTLLIENGEQEHDYFKKLFIKGIESEDVDNFSLQKKPGRYSINASHKSIYVYSKYREDLIVTVKNLLFKLSL